MCDSNRKIVSAQTKQFLSCSFSFDFVIFPDASIRLNALRSLFNLIRMKSYLNVDGWFDYKNCKISILSMLFDKSFSTNGMGNCLNAPHFSQTFDEMTMRNRCTVKRHWYETNNEFAFSILKKSLLLQCCHNLDELTHKNV